MDHAAQPSPSYKISLAWRYNSFSSYVSCQINLDSSGAIFVLVTQSIEETACPVCRLLSPESTRKNTCMSNAVMLSLHHDTFGKCTLKSDPWRKGERCWDDELISGVGFYPANGCLRLQQHVCVHAHTTRLIFSQRLNPTCTWQSLLSESKSCVSVETRLLSLLNGTAKIERTGTDACQYTFRALIVCHNDFMCLSCLCRM